MHGWYGSCRSAAALAVRSSPRCCCVWCCPRASLSRLSLSLSLSLPLSRTTVRTYICFVLGRRSDTLAKTALAHAGADKVFTVDVTGEGPLGLSFVVDRETCLAQVSATPSAAGRIARSASAGSEVRAGDTLLSCNGISFPTITAFAAATGSGELEAESLVAAMQTTDLRALFLRTSDEATEAPGECFLC